MTVSSQASANSPLESPLLFVAVQTAQQAEEVAALARSIWWEYYPPIIGPEQVAYMVDRFQSPAAILEQMQTGVDYFLVRQNSLVQQNSLSKQNSGEQNGAAVGYLALKEEPGDLLFLSKIYLVAQQRGQGQGQKMWDFVRKTARQRDLFRIYLTVNKHNTLALRRYQQWGFVQGEGLVADIGAGYVMDDWRMDWRMTDDRMDDRMDDRLSCPSPP